MQAIYENQKTAFAVSRELKSRLDVLDYARIDFGHLDNSGRQSLVEAGEKSGLEVIVAEDSLFLVRRRNQSHLRAAGSVARVIDEMKASWYRARKMDSYGHVRA